MGVQSKQGIMIFLAHVCRGHAPMYLNVLQRSCHFRGCGRITRFKTGARILHSGRAGLLRLLHLLRRLRRLFLLPRRRATGISTPRAGVDGPPKCDAVDAKLRYVRLEEGAVNKPVSILCG